MIIEMQIRLKEQDAISVMICNVWQLYQGAVCVGMVTQGYTVML
jgi:hypothetical protein